MCWCVDMRPRARVWLCANCSRAFEKQSKKRSQSTKRHLGDVNSCANGMSWKLVGVEIHQVFTVVCDLIRNSLVGLVLEFIQNVLLVCLCHKFINTIARLSHSWASGSCHMHTHRLKLHFLTSCFMMGKTQARLIMSYAHTTDRKLHFLMMGETRDAGVKLG